ncbi:Na(+)/H(+) exchange regulatory cofactor NHE-RF4 [Myotis lucifugus]|uniref:Na(+)/H(+) exchange regulatory cofactor NHE-RF4 n=1 Tax=Myotis lucifugus TaxID=59463 RepID=UPI000CCC83E6|nr:Na(+)/H(+) exchange regulatory cofactor NHE-RF4 [Myotis lucifugus]
MDLVPTLSARLLIQLWRQLQVGAGGAPGGDLKTSAARGGRRLRPRDQGTRCWGLEPRDAAWRKFEFNPKLGIDNPVLSLAEDRGPSGAPAGPLHPRPPSLQVARRIRASGPRVLLAVVAGPALDAARARQGDGALLCPTLGPEVRPRLCHIVRDEGGFGFSVTHEHKGSFWLVLSPGGAAERAGVPPGARLLEVNGVGVETLTHSQLSRRLWQSGEQVTLLVAGPEVEEQCRQRGMPLAAPLAEGWALPARPRCLHLEKGPQGFGFLLREEKGLGGRLGQFLWEVDPGLPADKAGMQAGDRLVAVAGESVEGLGHEETVSRIRAQGSRVALTVVDPEADRFFRMVRLSPLLFLESAEAPASPQSTRSASGAETEDPPGADTALPRAPRGSRQCCLYPGPGGGYGFRLSYVASGPRLSISQVTPGGSAARAGLQQGDEILEVNGRPVDGEDDVDRLHQLAEAEPPLCLKLGARSPRGWSGL